MTAEPIKIDQQATELVQQAIMDHLNDQSPAIKAAAKYTFDQFMNRCVVLSPVVNEPVPEPQEPTPTE